MMRYNQKHIAGFTLIEMIVSLAVFSMVVTTAVGAMLVLISTNQRLQAEQSVMTNLAFALDTMTREIRTGYNYYCASRPNYQAGHPDAIFDESTHESLSDSKQDCPSGRGSSNLHGISFYEEGDSITGAGTRRILYFFDNIDHTIKRRVGNAEAQPIVSSGLFIKDADFIVTGSENIAGSDIEQPTVTVYIEAQEKDDSDAKIYYLETTVTQRTLDI